MNRLLCALTVGALFLGCNGDGTGPRRGEETPLPPADQIMWPMRAALTDRGLMRAELEADTAYFYDDNARLELANVRLTFFSSAGARTSVLTSLEGTHHTRTGQSEARRNVIVVGDDGRRLTTEQLRYDQHTDEISSDSAFVFVPEPGRELRGIGFVSDPNLQNVRVLRQPEGIGTVELP